MADLTVLSRWFDLIKAEGWKTAFLGFAGVIYIYLMNKGFFPAVDAGYLQILYLFILICWALALASLFAYVGKFINFLYFWINLKIKSRNRVRAFREYIPYMTERERKILSYLLEKKIKVFTADSDGEYAATLVSRGILYFAVRRDQFVAERNSPFFIHDDIFREMERNRSSFPYEPERGEDGVDVLPWIMPWYIK